jgi:hypothetical protein
MLADVFLILDTNTTFLKCLSTHSQSTIYLILAVRQPLGYALARRSRIYRMLEETAVRSVLVLPVGFFHSCRTKACAESQRFESQLSFGSYTMSSNFFECRLFHANASRVTQMSVPFYQMSFVLYSSLCLRLPANVICRLHSSNRSTGIVPSTRTTNHVFVGRK